LKVTLIRKTQLIEKSSFYFLKIQNDKYRKAAQNTFFQKNAHW